MFQLHKFCSAVPKGTLALKQAAKSQTTAFSRGGEASGDTRGRRDHLIQESGLTAQLGQLGLS